MLTVKGVTRKTGVYEGNNYDNHYLHCLNDSPTDNTIAGEVCEVLKIKTANVAQVFNGAVKTDADWRGLVGMKIRAFYDRYRNVEQIVFVEE